MDLSEEFSIALAAVVVREVHIAPPVSIEVVRILLAQHPEIFEDGDCRVQLSSLASSSMPRVFAFLFAGLKFLTPDFALFADFLLFLHQNIAEFSL